MASFADIATKRLEDIERPPIPPRGMYRWQVTKIPSNDDMNDQYEKVSFSVKAVEAYDNVDADELKSFGGIKNVIATHDFIFDKTDDTKFAQTLFNLKNFIERHLAVEGAENMALSEALNASVNAQFDGELKWRPDKNDTSVFFAQMGKTAPVRA